MSRDLEIISLTGFGLKNETSMLVSTTNLISYHPSFLYFFHIPSLILSPISKAFASNSFSDSSFLSMFSFHDSCLTFDSTDVLTNPDQFTSGNLFICSLTSCGIDNVIDTILSPYYVEKHKNVEVFKSFALKINPDFTTSYVSFWSSSLGGLGTSYTQIKAANSSELASFNFSTSLTDWVNLTLYNQSIIKQLNYQDANDEAEIEVNLNVPADEPPGAKRTYITFYWESSPQ